MPVEQPLEMKSGLEQVRVVVKQAQGLVTKGQANAEPLQMLQSSEPVREPGCRGPCPWRQGLGLPKDSESVLYAPRVFRPRAFRPNLSHLRLKGMDRLGQVVHSQGAPQGALAPRPNRALVPIGKERPGLDRGSDWYWRP